jgi:hypothetical protein
MPLQTRIIPPRNVKVGDRIATTNGMREVLKVELHRHPKFKATQVRVPRVFRVDITVQDVMSDAGTVLSYYVDRPTKVTVQREAKVLEETKLEAEELQARTVFINHYCFESGATRADALAAWAKRKADAKIHCEVCGGNHVEEYHTPANV